MEGPFKNAIAAFESSDFIDQMKTKIIKGTVEDFFARGRAIAQALDKGELIEESHVISFDPEDGSPSKSEIRKIHKLSRKFTLEMTDD